MRIAPPKCSTCVVPKSAVHGNTSGSSARGTSKTASSSSLQHSRWMSKSIVRDAFVMSVTCRAPPVRFQMSHVSTVPNAISPASARARKPSTLSSSHAIFVAEKYGSSRSPVCTAANCDALRARGAGELVAVQTGLLLDPYFSATTNASRTMLFDIHRLCWSDELLAVFDVPRALLPDVLPCTADFGTTQVEHFGAAIRIAGVAGDQQAALVGQAGFMPGLAKSTYGTGSFVVLNTGERIVRSHCTAARRARDHRAVVRRRAVGARGRGQRWRVLRPGLHRARGAVLGSTRARHDRRDHARDDAGPPRARD